MTTPQESKTVNARAVTVAVMGLACVLSIILSVVLALFKVESWPMILLVSLFCAAMATHAGVGSDSNDSDEGCAGDEDFE